MRKQTIDLDSFENVRMVSDREFLGKIVGVVEDHLADPQFNIERFYASMGMSSSSTYRKVKMLTGMSPKEFVQDIRMKYACKMLEEKTANIADVAYAVGYSDAKYFSTCFKKVVGVSPSQYLRDGNSSLN